MVRACSLFPASRSTWQQTDACARFNQTMPRRVTGVVIIGGHSQWSSARAGSETVVGRIRDSVRATRKDLNGVTSPSGESPDRDRETSWFTQLCLDQGVRDRGSGDVGIDTFVSGRRCWPPGEDRTVVQHPASASPGDGVGFVYPSDAVSLRSGLTPSAFFCDGWNPLPQ